MITPPSHHHFRQYLKRILWPSISLALFGYFVFIPIWHVGLWNYLGKEYETNPMSRKVLDKFLGYEFKRSSKEWYDRVSRIDEKDIPNIKWEEDSISSQGIESFYCLDQQSDDVRPLLIKEWNLPYDKTLWWNARKTGDYLFRPDLAPSPIYDIEKTDSAVHIKTGDKYDTWAYLVAKHKQPTVYSIEFDFITHTRTQETLQICFASNSLAQRFRFNLENNETMKFDIVDHAKFLYGGRPDLWSKLRFPCSIPLHTPVHVKLVCVDNIFALYFDNNMVMAVKVKDYVASPNYFYLVFWNGVPGVDYKGLQDYYMDFEIKNFKVFHQQNP